MGTIVACDALSPLRGFYMGDDIPTGVDTPAYALAPYGLIINPILCPIHSLRASFPHCGLRAAISLYIAHSPQ